VGFLSICSELRSFTKLDTNFKDLNQIVLSLLLSFEPRLSACMPNVETKALEQNKLEEKVYFNFLTILGNYILLSTGKRHRGGDTVA